MTDCVTGCALHGQHRPAGDEPHPESCRGCLPRPATEGNLCQWCWNRLTEAVDSLPELVVHLREIGKPYAQTAPPSDGKSYVDPAFGTVLPAAWTTADELHAGLASYAHLILEEHPDGWRMTGPDQSGAVRSTTTVHDAGDGYGTFVRHPSVVGFVDPTATVRLVDWIRPLLPWCAEQEWAGEMRRELVEAVSTTRHRWPTVGDVEPARPIRDIPCPRCDLMSLVYTPARHYRQAFRVECTDTDCARVFSEDEWDRFKALWEQRGVSA